jgi:hypothetical protein
MGKDNGADGANQFGVLGGGGDAAEKPMPAAETPSSSTPTAFEIQPPGQVIKEDGRLYRFDEGPWIRINTSFRDEWLRRLKGPQLSLFICLALHIDDRNHAFPSIERIAMLTGFSDRHIRRAVQAAEKDGWLEVHRSTGSHNRYTLHAPVKYGPNVGGGQNVTPISGDGELSTTEDTGVRGVRTPMSYDPGHPRPPKKNHKDKPKIRGKGRTHKLRPKKPYYGKPGEGYWHDND